MSFLKKYATDKNAEKNGVWVEIDEGTEIKVARLNNPVAREERRKLEQPYRGYSSGVPESKQEEIMRKVVALAVLRDWKGVTGADGKDIPYSAEKAEEVFIEYPDFLNDVVAAAMVRETFQVQTKDAVKNA